MSITEVIKYEGDNKTFIWKHPCEDFNTDSQLIVHESQEAVFYKDGQSLDLFGPGRYTLETENIPIIRKVMNLPTGGISPFHCEVYFINKVEQMAIKWGTDSKIEYMDPIYHFPIAIGASGEMFLSIADSKKVLIKLVGTEKILKQEDLVNFLKAFLMIKVKTYIAQEMKKSKVPIFEIDEKLEQFSDDLKIRLEKDFLDYGINLNRFFVTTIVKPDNEANYEKFKDLHFREYSDIKEAELEKKVGIIKEQAKKEQMLIESSGLAEKRKIEGYTYQQERGYDIASKAASNEGSGGQLASMGIGLGMMTAIGNTVNQSVNKAFVENTFCSKCGFQLERSSFFCPKCGKKQENCCLNCGYIFVNTDNFCPKCGKKRGEQ